MAGNEDRDGIAAVGMAHRARGGRLGHALSKLGVCNRCVEGNLHQRLPHALLERRAVELKWDVELLPLASKILAELLADCGEWRVGVLPRSIGFGLPLVTWHEQTRHELSVTCDKHSAQGALEVGVVNGRGHQYLLQSWWIPIGRRVKAGPQVHGCVRTPWPPSLRCSLQRRSG